MTARRESKRTDASGAINRKSTILPVCVDLMRRRLGDCPFDSGGAPFAFAPLEWRFQQSSRFCRFATVNLLVVFKLASEVQDSKEGDVPLSELGEQWRGRPVCRSETSPKHLILSSHDTFAECARVFAHYVSADSPLFYLIPAYFH